MATPLIPQEIYLLERYVSTDYFDEMRDAWAAMVTHAERCLDAFVHDLPLDYRKRQLSEQPDIVWGERVLVNFRHTRDCLDRGFIELTHGHMESLAYASNVVSDFAGFSRDYSSEWMDEPSVAKVISNGSEEFWRLLGEALEQASNIKRTVYAQWIYGALTSRFREQDRGPLNPPAQWPTYRPHPTVRAATGKPVPQTGIYLPDTGDAAAAFMIEGKVADTASVGYDPKTTQNIGDSATSWTLIERVSDTGGGEPGAQDEIRAGVRPRCEAGQPCPREGYWFTPARANSRRRFSTGEVMPEVGGDYGSTIWQWDENQQ